MTGNQIAMLYHKSRGYNPNLNNHKVTKMRSGVVHYEIYHVLYKIHPDGNAELFSANDRDNSLGVDVLRDYESSD